MRPGERGHRPPRRSVRERVDSCALSVRSAKVRNLRTSRAALARVFVVAARRREPSCPFAGTRVPGPVIATFFCSLLSNLARVG
jgi:hypothetical protein